MGRKFYLLVGPDGKHYNSAGNSYILECAIAKGFRWDTNEKGELIRVPLPNGCCVIKVDEKTGSPPTP